MYILKQVKWSETLYNKNSAYKNSSCFSFDIEKGMSPYRLLSDNSLHYAKGDSIMNQSSHKH